MQWVALGTVFASAMVKFLFSPAVGPALGLSFFETYFSNLAGALVSMVIFYFAADFFLKRSHEKKVQKLREALDSGIVLPQKKIFTKRNKMIIRVKNKIGMVPFCFWVPLFLSIPIGSIITAKFYGKRAVTFPLMVIGAVLNNTITVSFVYLVKNGASSLL